MLGQLRAQGGLDHPAGQPGEQAARASDLLRLKARQGLLELLPRQQAREPVDDLLRQLLTPTGLRLLHGHGVPLPATAVSASRKAVRAAGLDIGVHRSDRRSRPGKLTRQGSPQLRWALYESAQAACRPTSPDRADYLELKQRGLSHTRASLTISRKLARRSFHTLRELGPRGARARHLTQPAHRPFRH